MLDTLLMASIGLALASASVLMTIVCVTLTVDMIKSWGRDR